MNTGAEAVETALKAARKWAYAVKGVPANQAEIIVCEGNFHGRTISIVSASTEPQYRDGFGPFTPGFKVIPYGDIEALRAAQAWSITTPAVASLATARPRKGWKSWQFVFYRETSYACRRKSKAPPRLRRP